MKNVPEGQARGLCVYGEKRLMGKTLVIAEKPSVGRDIANALPDSFKMRGTETKSILRRIGRRVLPREIADARKIGFTAPVAALIRNELAGEVRELLGAAHLKRQGLFDGAYVGRLVDEHFSGRHNHYKQIWVLYMLQKWLHGRKALSP